MKTQQQVIPPQPNRILYSKRYFLFAANRIMEFMAQNSFGIQSLEHVDIYKEYVLFFTRFAANFTKHTFDKYITTNYNAYLSKFKQRIK